MLLKWLFTLLAILWLYEAITRIARDRQKTRIHYREKGPLDEKEYTDYEDLDKK